MIFQNPYMWTVAKYESVQLVCFTRWLYECMCDIFEVLYLFWIYFTRAKSIASIYTGFTVKTQMTFKIILKFRKSLKFVYLDFVKFGNIQKPFLGSKKIFSSFVNSTSIIHILMWFSWRITIALYVWSFYKE